MDPATFFAITAFSSLFSGLSNYAAAQEQASAQKDAAKRQENIAKEQMEQQKKELERQKEKEQKTTEANATALNDVFFNEKKKKKTQNDYFLHEIEGGY